MAYIGPNNVRNRLLAAIGEWNETRIIQCVGVMKRRGDDKITVPQNEWLELCALADFCSTSKIKKTIEEDGKEHVVIDKLPVVRG